MNAGAGTIVAERVLERGRERLRTKLPAVITVSAEAPPIRYASLPHLLDGLRYVPEIWTVQDVDLDPEFIGSNGSPTRVQQLVPAPQREGGKLLRVDEVGLEEAVSIVLKSFSSS